MWSLPKNNNQYWSGAQKKKKKLRINKQNQVCEHSSIGFDLLVAKS